LFDVRSLIRSRFTRGNAALKTARSYRGLNSHQTAHYNLLHWCDCDAILHTYIHNFYFRK